MIQDSMQQYQVTPSHQANSSPEKCMNGGSKESIKQYLVQHRSAGHLVLATLTIHTMMMERMFTQSVILLMWPDIHTWTY